MNSFIVWIGGKKLLRKEIVKRFPEKFNRYIDVFGGACGMGFIFKRQVDKYVSIQ